MRAKNWFLVLALICVFSSLCLIASFNHVLAAQAAGPPQNTDWPMFHYDLSHDGYTSSVGPMTNNILWSVKAGSMTVSPAVANGVVYSGGVNLTAHDALTGVSLWNFTAPHDIYGYSDAITSPPTVANGIVYAGAYDGYMYAVNANTGSLIWQYQTDGVSYYDDPYVGEITQAATVINGVVYFGSCGGYVYALNAATGAYDWSYDVGGSYEVGDIDTVSACSTPTFAAGMNITYTYNSNNYVAANVIYVGGAGGQVDALDASNGNLIWTYQTGGTTGARDGVDSCPCVSGNVVYVGSTDDCVYALNADTGTLIWKYQTGGFVSASPAVANGVVYIGSGDGKMYALTTSGSLLWSYQVPQGPSEYPGAVIYSSAAVANGVVYFGSEDYSVFALSATSTTTTGNLIWTYQTGYDTDSSPAIASGIMYIESGDGYLYAFDGVSASISPSSLTMDVGQQQTFTLSALGGEGSLGYEWYVNGAATGQTGSTLSFTAQASEVGSSVSIYAVATDGLGVTGKSNTATITVNAALTATVSPSSTAVDWRDGQQITYTVTPSGGTGKLNYQWYQDNSQIDGATHTTYLSYASYNSVGSHTIYCTVTDSATTPVTVDSNTADLTVYPSLSVTVSPSSATTPSSASVDPGQSATFTATPTGGSGTYTYQWYVNYATQGSVTSSSTLIYSTTTPGQYNIGVEVLDSISSASFYSSAPNLNVNSPPFATISPSSPTMDVNQQQLFYVATIGGGEGPYTYEWYLNGADTHQSGAYFYYTAQASDVTNPPTITVVPTDSYDLAGQSNYVTPTVNPALTASVTPTSWNMTVGQLQTFLVSSSGGTGTVTYEWYVNGLDSGKSGSAFDYTAQNGDVDNSPSIYAVATDTVNGQATSNVATITVNPAENVASTSGNSAAVTSGSVTVDQTSTTGVSATVTGTSLQNGQTIDVNSAYYGSNQPSGTGTVSVSGAVFYDVAVSQAGGAALGSDVTVQVSLTDPSITSSSVIQYWDSSSNSWVQVSTAFTAPDTVSGNIPADDLTGTSIAVVTPLTALSVTISPSTPTMDVGQQEIFQATASGGTSPYSYEWYLNSQDTGKSGLTFTYTAQASGISSPPSIYAIATDSIEDTAQSNTATIKVNSALTAPTVTPSSSSLTQGGTSTLSSSAVTTGTSLYKYQWYDETPGASSYSLIGSATSSTYSFVTTASTTAGNWNFILQVTDSAGTAVNSTATSVTVNTPTSTPTATPTPTGTSTSTPTSTPSPTQTPKASPSPSPTPTPHIPEFPSIIIVTLVFLAATATTALLYKKKYEKNTKPVCVRN
jgi:outer membrane protein assembly factor BamB